MVRRAPFGLDMVRRKSVGDPMSPAHKRCRYRHRRHTGAAHYLRSWEGGDSEAYLLGHDTGICLGMVSFSSLGLATDRIHRCCFLGGVRCPGEKIDAVFETVWFRVVGQVPTTSLRQVQFLSSSLAEGWPRFPTPRGPPWHHLEASGLQVSPHGKNRLWHVWGVRRSGSSN